MKHKSFNLDLIETKADEQPGAFTALASVFGSVDLVGDRMMPGAFKRTLKDWRRRNDPIPVILSHNWDDPMMNIGGANPHQVRETDRGLEVKGQLDVGRNPIADQVYHLMKERRLKGWSFGYTTPDGGEKRGKDGANEVFEVDLIEVGPTLKGAHPEAETMAVKALMAEAKFNPAQPRDEQGQWTDRVGGMPFGPPGAGVQFPDATRTGTTTTGTTGTPNSGPGGIWLPGGGSVPMVYQPMPQPSGPDKPFHTMPASGPFFPGGLLDRTGFGPVPPTEAPPKRSIQEMSDAEIREQIRNTDSPELKETLRAELEYREETGTQKKFGTKEIGEHRGPIWNLINYYLKKPHPFTSCVRDNTKRFGPEGAKRVCATLKDMGLGTTHWRRGRSAAEAVRVASDRDWAQELYDACEGNVEGLMEMWREHIARNGDDPVTVMNGEEPAKSQRPKPQDPLRRLGDEIAFEIHAKEIEEAEVIPTEEQTVESKMDELVRAGSDFLAEHGDDPRTEPVADLLKAVWTTAYINGLPDSAFLYVEPDGKKDSEGKTQPRTLRHFPYKDASGAVDLPHLRNAISRIPQSNLPSDVKDRVQARARRILDSQKSASNWIEAPSDEEPFAANSGAQDPLRRRGDLLAFEIQTHGVDWDSVEPEPPASKEEPRDLTSVSDLRRRSHELEVQTLIGSQEKSQ